MNYCIAPFDNVWQNGVFNVPCDIIDKYIKLSSEYQIKALLLVLQNSGSASTEYISKTLGLTKSDVSEIMSFWTEEGVLICKESEMAEKNFTNAKKEPKKVQKDEQKETQKVVKTHEVLPAPRLTPKDIVDLCRENKTLFELLNEAQKILGRTISGAEEEMIVNMNNYYELPPEVILMLLSHYRSEKEKGKSISIAYINKMAHSWAEEGILTVNDADEKLTSLAKNDEYWNKIVEMTGIKHKNPTQKQRDMIEQWRTDFSEDMIERAAEIMKENAEKPSLKYVSAVLSRWKKDSISTIAEVDKQQSDFEKNKAQKDTAQKGKNSKLMGKPSYDLDKIIENTSNNTDIKF